MKDVYAMTLIDVKAREFFDFLRREKAKIDEHARREKAKIDALMGSVEPLLSPESTDGAQQGPTRKLSGDWIEEILRNHQNIPMHYREIAREAVAVGYKGVIRADEAIGSRAHIDRIAGSFSGTLAREKDRFEATGGGYYRLKILQQS